MLAETRWLLCSFAQDCNIICPKVIKHIATIVLKSKFCYFMHTLALFRIILLVIKFIKIVELYVKIISRILNNLHFRISNTWRRILQHCPG